MLNLKPFVPHQVPQLLEGGAHPGGGHRGQPVLQRDQHPLLRLLQGAGVHGEELVGQVHPQGGETRRDLEETVALLEQECMMLSAQCGASKVCDIVQIIVAGL